MDFGKNGEGSCTSGALIKATRAQHVGEFRGGGILKIIGKESGRVTGDKCVSWVGFTGVDRRARNDDRCNPGGP